MDTLVLERRGPVAWLRLNRPAKRNAQTRGMWDELRGVGAELVGDPGVRCLVVTGEGSSFSAGIDLRELAGGDGDLPSAGHGSGRADQDPLVAMIGQIQTAFTWIPAAPFPSVAAVNGHALGAGLQLALACDLRVLASDALVGLIEFRWGLLPDLGGTEWLPRIVGAARARELVLTAARVDAEEALRIGLANRVVAPDELEVAATELAGTLAAQPPLAVRNARRALDAAFDTPGRSLELAALGQAECLRSADFAEAVRAAAERRQPQYQGR
jgi:enoyl-CoA hydratase/carnithine racemase